MGFFGSKDTKNSNLKREIISLYCGVDEIYIHKVEIRSHIRVSPEEITIKGNSWHAILGYDNSNPVIGKGGLTISVASALPNPEWSPTGFGFAKIYQKNPRLFICWQLGEKGFDQLLNEIRWQRPGHIVMWGEKSDSKRDDEGDEYIIHSVELYQNKYFPPK